MTILPELTVERGRTKPDRVRHTILYATCSDSAHGEIKTADNNVSLDRNTIRLQPNDGRAFATIYYRQFFTDTSVWHAIRPLLILCVYKRQHVPKCRARNMATGKLRLLTPAVCVTRQFPTCRNGV